MPVQPSLCLAGWPKSVRTLCAQSPPQVTRSHRTVMVTSLSTRFGLASSGQTYFAPSNTLKT